MVATDALAKDGADTKGGDPSRREGLLGCERAVVAAAALGAAKGRHFQRTSRKIQVYHLLPFHT